MLTQDLIQKLDKLDDKQEKSAKQKLMKEGVIKKYISEKCSPGFDIGRGTVSRSYLRVACKDMVMESSTSTYRRGLGQSASSASAMSTNSNIYVDSRAPNGFLKALRKLQQERMAMARLGYFEKAIELDEAIQVMREKAKEQRKSQEKKIINERTKAIKRSLKEKSMKFEEELKKEIEEMESKFNLEGEELLRRQERDFINCIKAATRRAIGRVKKCNCEKPYLCQHNKTASYNTRKPSKEVVQYRRNADRLKRGGKPEEAILWQEKASALDQQEQEAWRNRIATGIVISAWGANEAVVDQMADEHRKQLQALKKTHYLKRNMLLKTQEVKRRNFENLQTSELRRGKLLAKKEAAQLFVGSGRHRRMRIDTADDSHHDDQTTIGDSTSPSLWDRQDGSRTQSRSGYTSEGAMTLDTDDGSENDFDTDAGYTHNNNTHNKSENGNQSSNNQTYNPSFNQSTGTNQLTSSRQDNYFTNTIDYSNNNTGVINSTQRRLSHTGIDFGFTSNSSHFNPYLDPFQTLPTPAGPSSPNQMLSTSFATNQFSTSFQPLGSSSSPAIVNTDLGQRIESSINIAPPSQPPPSQPSFRTRRTSATNSTAPPQDTLQISDDAAVTAGSPQSLSIGPTGASASSNNLTSFTSPLNRIPSFLKTAQSFPWASPLAFLPTGGGFTGTVASSSENQKSNPFETSTVGSSSTFQTTSGFAGGVIPVDDHNGNNSNMPALTTTTTAALSFFNPLGNTYFGYTQYSNNMNI